MKVLIIMGSDSDYPIVEKSLTTLRDFSVEFECRVLSAHRTPYLTLETAKNAEKNGFGVIIGAAGKAAHLAGVIASVTTLPVIGLPIKTSSLAGMDSLYSMVQMPKGVPVATVALDGAENAAILAVQILALSNKNLKDKLVEHKMNMEKLVMKMDKGASQRLGEKDSINKA